MSIRADWQDGQGDQQVHQGRDRQDRVPGPAVLNPPELDDPTYGLEPVLTVDEAARFLRVNRKTLYEAVKARQVPAKRVGRRVVILRDALVEWLRSNGA